MPTNRNVLVLEIHSGSQGPIVTHRGESGARKPSRIQRQRQSTSQAMIVRASPAAPDKKKKRGLNAAAGMPRRNAMSVTTSTVTGDKVAWVQAGMERAFSDIWDTVESFQACRDAIKRNVKLSQSIEGQKWTEMLDSREFLILQNCVSLSAKLKQCLNMNLPLPDGTKTENAIASQAHNAQRLYYEFIRKICHGEIGVFDEYKSGITNDDKIKLMLRESYDKIYQAMSGYSTSLEGRISAALKPKGCSK